ncbi:MAG: hypothetical protein IJP96_01530 [Synergistaceae bacterium]|nr:hypothetical protein [Synergistaceae bacterium]MBQ6737793.1 hypothetical protein [Synergistaceae bacterium]MBR0074420.1 hypothetical protein [Synergistaceae bacterium]MBR0080329.1 hypothetical protein [Synergistaceae bacterium]MBR0081104.1 hypothetical protein [Synergistaceae bacterium]
MKKLQKSEYLSLRDELVMRIQLINSQENTALLTAISFGAAVIALQKDSVQIISVIGYIQALLLFFLIVVLIPIASKSGENLRQIATISAYIKVFYEYPSLNGDYKHPFLWETILGKSYFVSYKQNNFLIFANMEYTFLSAISTIMLFIRLITIESVSDNMQLLWDDKITEKSLIICIAIIAITILLFYITKSIFNMSCVKNNMIDMEGKLLPDFIKQAKDMKVIDEKTPNENIISLLAQETYKL